MQPREFNAITEATAIWDTETHITFYYTHLKYCTNYRQLRDYNQLYSLYSLLPTLDAVRVIANLDYLDPGYSTSGNLTISSKNRW